MMDGCVAKDVEEVDTTGLIARTVGAKKRPKKESKIQSKKLLDLFLKYFIKLSFFYSI
jgi:hypothetical protein